MTLPATLIEVLETNRDAPRHITYLDGQNERRRVSFAALRRTALGVLHHLQAFGAQPGDRIILHTSSNEQFIDGFWACLLGGLVPVPVAVGISDDHRLKLLQVFGQLGRPMLYTEAAQLSRLEDYGRQSGQTEAVTALAARSLTIERVTDIGTAGKVYPARPDDLAFVQYSSGSTSTPKGVELTHRNILTNIGAIIERAAFTDQDISLSWMPLTHDMGLIGFHLCMLTARIEHTIMDTRLFSRRPLLWLEEASRIRATLTSSPNFGYKHFLKLYESKGLADGVDLSCIRLLFNGAEPISVPLCERFITAMIPHGLSPTAMYPVYGLAEACLAVSFPAPGRAFRAISLERSSLGIGRQATTASGGGQDGLALMVLGTPLRDTFLRIADDDDRPVPDGTVGHVQIRGGNVTRGYTGIPASGQPFTADGWLRTGDLGFLTAADAELVITGRYKEIIFVNGQNYYPHDLESIAEASAGIELGKVAAAAARRGDGDEDELLLFLIQRGPLADFLPLANQLRRQLTEQTGLSVAHVVPVRNLPKTTSGKLQRAKLAADYEAGSFDGVLAELDALAPHAAVTSDAGESEMESRIRQICAAVITDRAIGLDDDFFELGVSSLTLARIHERIDEEYPGRLDVEDLFTKSTIRAVAAHLEGSGE